MAQNNEDQQNPYDLPQSRRDILNTKLDGGVSRNMSHMQLD